MKKIVLNMLSENKSFVLCGSPSDNSILGPIEKNGGFYESHIMNLLKTIIHPSSICLDIGANIGVISLVLSHYARDGKVYSFEPSPTNYRYLVQNIAENLIQNMEAVNLGAYDRNTTLDFFDIENGGGWSFVSNGTVQGVPNQAATSVRTDDWAVQGLPNHVATCVRIDDWVKASGIPKLDFIKMDIEGGEIKAIHGAISTLYQYHPDLVIEFNPEFLARHFGNNPMDLYLLLKSIYPSIYFINFDHSLVKIDDYSHLMRLKGSYILGDMYCTFKM